jgi:quinoprotein glucose dehydrogenase
VIPGHNGGPLWGGGAFDPESEIFYVSAHDQPSYFKMTRQTTRMAGTPLARGRQLYRSNCAACHGNSGKGVEAIMGPLLAPAASTGVAGDVEIADLTAMTLDANAFSTVVRLGKNRMPPSSQLSDAEMGLLFDYVRRIGEPAAHAEEGPDGESELRFTTPWTFFRDSAQLPAIKPPWGRMTAIDMKTGDTLWVKLIGDEQSLAERGVPQTGQKYLRGGPVVTAGGLVFIAATADEKIRAFDQETGEILWEGDLPASGFATPATYSINGRQYLVIACGGGRVRRPSSDVYVAFALPAKKRK